MQWVSTSLNILSNVIDHKADIYMVRIDGEINRTMTDICQQNTGVEIDELRTTVCSFTTLPFMLPHKII